MNKNSKFAKLGVLVLLVAMTFTLAACSDDDDGDTTNMYNVGGEITGLNSGDSAIVEITVDNGNPVTKTVTSENSAWNKKKIEEGSKVKIEAYDEAGNYKFTAKDSGDNPVTIDSLNANNTINFTAEEDVNEDEVVSISSVNDITATIKEGADYSLPQTVDVEVAEQEETVEVNVNWNGKVDVYDNSEQTIEGELELGAGVKNPDNLTAKATITVEMDAENYEEATPESVAAQLKQVNNFANLNSITENLTLPQEMNFAGNEYDVEWSTNSDVIDTATGEVNRPAVGAEDATVELTATLDYQGVSNQAKGANQVTIEVTVVSEAAGISGISTIEDSAQFNEANQYKPEVKVKIDFNVPVSKDSEFQLSGKANIRDVEYSDESTVIVTITDYIWDAELDLSQVKFQDQEFDEEQATKGYDLEVGTGDLEEPYIEVITDTQDVLVRPDDTSERANLDFKFGGALKQLYDKLDGDLTASLDLSTQGGYGSITSDINVEDASAEDVGLTPGDISEKRTTRVEADTFAVKDTDRGVEYDFFRYTPTGKSPDITFHLDSDEHEDDNEDNLLIKKETSQYGISNVIANQADRLTVNLNRDLANETEKEEVVSFFKKMTIDNDKKRDLDDFKYLSDKVNVDKVKVKDANTLILILDVANDGPLRDHAQHRVDLEEESEYTVYEDEAGNEVDQENADIKVNITVGVTGDYSPFLEDTDNVRMLRVETSEDSNNLEDYQIRVYFSETLNSSEQENSVRKLENWTINGRNLDTELPSKNGTVNIKVENSNDEELDGKTGDTVLINFENVADRREFIANAENGGRDEHKIVVSGAGDWASVSDDNNIVSTEGVNYDGIDINVDTEVELIKESPEQYLVRVDNAVNPVKADDIELYYGSEEYTGENGTAIDAKAVTELQSGLFLVELTEDWTQIHDTDGTGDNYYDSVEDTITVEVAGLTNVWEEELDIADRVDTVELTEDTSSPYTINPEDKDNIRDGAGIEVLTTEYDDNINNAGQARITMNEPVQWKDRNKVYTSPNSTPSQSQDKKVPKITIQYVRTDSDSDRTVDGEIKELDNTLSPTAAKVDIESDRRDYSAIIQPEEELESGNWKLVARELSDDVGNTMATEVKKFSVEKTDDPVDPDPDPEPELTINDIEAGLVKVEHHQKVDIKPYGEETRERDVVHIVYSKEMDIDEMTDTENYSLNHTSLPAQDTNIVRGLVGYEDDKYSEFANPKEYPHDNYKIAWEYSKVGTNEYNILPKIVKPGTNLNLDIDGDGENETNYDGESNEDYISSQGEAEKLKSSYKAATIILPAGFLSESSSWTIEIQGVETTAGEEINKRSSIPFVNAALEDNDVYEFKEMENDYSHGEYVTDENGYLDNNVLGRGSYSLDVLDTQTLNILTK
ncbi:MAG: immunoglobulin-like domain-containing protein [Bacillota bacterium]